MSSQKSWRTASRDGHPQAPAQASHTEAASHGHLHHTVSCCAQHGGWHGWHASSSSRRRLQEATCRAEILAGLSHLWDEHTPDESTTCRQADLTEQNGTAPPPPAPAAGPPSRPAWGEPKRARRSVPTQPCHLGTCFLATFQDKEAGRCHPGVLCLLCGATYQPTYRQKAVSSMLSYRHGDVLSHIFRPVLQGKTHWPSYRNAHHIAKPQGADELAGGPWRDKLQSLCVRLASSRRPFQRLPRESPECGSYSPGGSTASPSSVCSRFCTA